MPSSRKHTGGKQGRHKMVHPWEAQAMFGGAAPTDRSRFKLGAGPPCKMLSRGDFSRAEIRQMEREYGTKIAR